MPLVLTLLLSPGPAGFPTNGGLRLRIVGVEIREGRIEARAAIANRGARPVRIYEPSAFATVEGAWRFAGPKGILPKPKIVDVGLAAYRTKTIMPGGALTFTHSEEAPRFSRAHGARASFRLRYDSTYAVSRFEENGWPRKPACVRMSSQQVVIGFVGGRAVVRGGSRSK